MVFLGPRERHNHSDFCTWEGDARNHDESFNRGHLLHLIRCDDLLAVRQEQYWHWFWLWCRSLLCIITRLYTDGPAVHGVLHVCFLLSRGGLVESARTSTHRCGHLLGFILLVSGSCRILNAGVPRDTSRYRDASSANCCRLRPRDTCARVRPDQSLPLDFLDLLSHCWVASYLVRLEHEHERHAVGFRDTSGTTSFFRGVWARVC
mmetsp:Transcript_41894/g.78058  ORF Transcript_41894/g.78058 Transcript_41894/m.78058 type:complete len:206 (-) Transcript_41894:1465-2082(-)